MKSTDGPALSSVRAPRKGAYRWPMIVVGLLVTHVVLMLLAASIATRDRSFAVLPNYYENAVKWDQTRAAQRDSDTLGWKLTIDPSTSVTPLGQRSIAFTLKDSSGKPVENANLSVDYYHHSHAKDAASIKLQQTEPGRFVTTLPMRYPGFWQFNVTAEAGGKTFVDNLSQYVNTELVLK